MNARPQGLHPVIAGSEAEEERCVPALNALLELPPLSLYVHLPWCTRKCPYCDFNSFEASGTLPEDAYVDALLADFDADVPLAQDRALRSVFIGGGTPSLFSGAAIRKLLDGIRERIALPDAAEITLEANPGSVEAERFAAYRDAGVNRLSVGVQSFRDEQLKKLGRVHGAEEALCAYVTARSAGFENINLDLMYGLPDDDIHGALVDLARAVELAPPHLSWYQLTLEPNTAFHHAPPALPDDDTIIEMEQSGRALLAAHGYKRYEVSAYARPERRCAHNVNYWEFGDYLGIGAGAHGKVTVREQSVVERRAKQRNPRMYMKLAGTGAVVSTERIDSQNQIIVEFFMNALRLTDGVALSLFEASTGVPRALVAPSIAAACARSLLTHANGRIQPTERGMSYLNDLIGLFDARCTYAGAPDDGGTRDPTWA